MRKASTNTLRRLMTLALALLLVAGLTGCWRKDDPDPSTDPLPPVQNDPQPSTSQAPTTQTPTEAPTEAPTEETKPVQTTTMATVTATKLNIRTSADSTAGVVGSYFQDDRIELLEINGDWGRTAKGWISMAYVKVDDDTTNNDNTEADNKDDDDKTTTNTDIVSDGKTRVLGYGVVSLGALNVRTGPGTDYEKVGTVSLGNQYAYYQKSGNWARIEDGWVSTTYFYIEGTTGDGAGNGTITGEGLNVRSGPGTDHDRVGSYAKGDTVKILTQINGWGYTSKGWISMKYVEMDGSATTGTTGTTGKGTVTADALNIRKSATTDSDAVGKYYKGDEVEILEVKGDWGRTDKGWISLNYVKMDGTTTATTTYKTGKGTITASELNIRKEASINSESIGSYKREARVEILEVKDDWGRTDKGWINLKYVKMD